MQMTLRGSEPAPTHTKLHKTIAFLLIAVLLAGTAFAAQQSLMLTPKASSKVISGSNGTSIDYGNSAEGYVIVSQEPSDKKHMLTIFRGKSSYTYELNNKGVKEIYPLQMGSGLYEIEVYKHVTGNRYSVIEKASFNVELNDNASPYLYPSQYVNYNKSTLAIAKSNSLCKGAKTDQQKVDAVFNYIKKTIKYNKKRAKTVKSGYIPDLNEVFRSRKGICFDYAALMACMLRVQGIPTQLVIGYVNGSYYHAWNKVFVGGRWVLYDPTLAASKQKGKSYKEDRVY